MADGKVTRNPIRVEEVTNGRDKKMIRIVASITNSLDGREDRVYPTELVSESNQRELLAWFKEHRTEMVREIFCEDCPEVC